MKLLNSFGPNPRMLRMFIAEKGIELESVEHDLMAAENRQGAYTARNPGGQMPALELDDGTVLAETVVICDYLEEVHPAPALIGANPAERAEARMWNRRIEQKVTENMYAGFRFAEGLGLFKDRIRCIPEMADGHKLLAQDGLAWLEPLLEGKDFLCGERMTIGDLVLFCCCDFAAGVGQSIDPSLTNVSAWFARMSDRPSAAASLHPGAAKSGMKG
ncbi:MAG: glutathione S-transferase [Gammaproteobacteria bacterium]